MNDLIWVGNTLYPRWVVFLAMGLVVTAIIVVFTVITSKAGE
jgi:hypothetical protein